MFETICARLCNSVKKIPPKLLQYKQTLLPWLFCDIGRLQVLLGRLTMMILSERYDSTYRNDIDGFRWFCNGHINIQRIKYDLYL